MKNTLKKVFGVFALLGMVGGNAVHAQIYVFDSNIGNAGGSGQVILPNDVAIDSNGNLFVTDTNKSRIAKFNPSGSFVQAFGSYGSGSGQFLDAAGIVIDSSGNIFVADTFNNRIQKFTGGSFVQGFGAGYNGVAGTIGSYGSSDGQLHFPGGVAVDSSGNIFAADFKNNRIVEFTRDGSFVQTFGSYGNGNGQLWAPSDVAVDSSGNVFVTDFANTRIVEFNSSGNFVQNIGYGQGNGNGQLAGPRNIAIDRNGNLFVVDYGNSRIVEFNSSGNFVQNIGYGLGGGNGQLNNPEGIAVDRSGNLFVADTYNNRIVKFRNLLATVIGSIALADVPDLSQISPDAPLGTFHIAFRTQGTTTEVYAADVTLTNLGATGTFTVSNIPPATYDVSIKGSKNLSVTLPNVTFSVGTSLTLPEVTLPAGDANNDNRVDIGDFGLLINVYGSDASDPTSGYDPAADINYDGTVDIGDFGLLINEYGKVGDL